VLSNIASTSTVDDAPPRGKREVERIARRSRLLDAAEQRFADVGYEATVLRDVTAAAGTRLASVTEEFGGKEQLFREVLIRRALPLEQERLRRLAQVAAGLRGQKRLGAIVSAFIDPMLERAQESAGWRNYFRFIALLANSRLSVQLSVAADYNRIARHFLDAFGSAYPDANAEAVHDAYLLMLASTLEVFANTPRLDSLSRGRYRSANLRRRTHALHIYVTAGIQALLTTDNIV
jgi:AcrR family transcriptional regulator